MAAIAGCPFSPAGPDTDGDTPTEGTGGANAKPVAVAGDDREALVGEPIAFDASASFDPDGEILIYTWKFGDGTASAQAAPTHTYVEPGEYTVELAVVDNVGAIGRDTLVVTVTESPPTVEQFAVTVIVTPVGAGTVTLDPPGGAYESGTEVMIRASPNTGFRFLGYSGDFEDASGVITVTVTQDLALSADFEAIVLVTASASVQPDAAGTVTIDPPGGIYESGTSITLTATASAGFVFDAYLDDQGAVVGNEPVLVIVVEQDTFLTARFIPTGGGPPPAPPSVFTLTIVVSPGGSGSVSLDPPGGSYTEGTVVTLMATPNEGHAFVQYAQDAAGSDPSTTVTMNSNKTIRADFELIAQLGDSGNLLVTSLASKTVVEFDGVTGTRLGTIIADDPATENVDETGGLSTPWGIDFSPSGDIFVAGSVTGIFQYNSDGTLVGLGPFAIGGFFQSLRVGPNDNLFVTELLTDSVIQYNAMTGESVGTFISAGSGGLDNALGFTFGSNGNLFVVSGATDTIIEYDGTTGDPTGTFADLGAAGFTSPFDLAFDSAGNLFVTLGAPEHSVARVDGVSREVTRFVPEDDPDTDAIDESGGLDFPAGIMFHPTSGNLLVVSLGTNAVLEYDGATGDFVGLFAAGTETDNLFFMAFRP